MHNWFTVKIIFASFKNFPIYSWAILKIKESTYSPFPASNPTFMLQYPTAHIISFSFQGTTASLLRWIPWSREALGAGKRIISLVKRQCFEPGLQDEHPHTHTTLSYLCLVTPPGKPAPRASPYLMQPRSCQLLFGPFFGSFGIQGKCHLKTFFFLSWVAPAGLQLGKTHTATFEREA